MNLLLSLILLFITHDLLAQDSYWQQEVNYSIKVRLDDQQHFLRGNIEIDYHNNSPDTLNLIYLHLWPNAYKDRSTALVKQLVENGKTDLYFARENDRGFIDSLNFEVNGQDVYWSTTHKHLDIARLSLTESLLPGKQIRISTPFRVKLPESYSRLGHVGQQYQLTQWYPKPAVYDHQGWHPMPYLDQGEFYSEFGRFEVEITLPENYVVGATGLLQNESEKEFLRNKAAGFSESNSNLRFTPSASKTKTLRFIQDQVHDFAWFAGKDYRVALDTMVFESGREVSLIAIYNPSGEAVWENINSYMEDAIRFYSERVGEYPYDAMTVVDGALGAGAGMEYPMITVLSAEEPFFLDLVTFHEIGHNWFYGILASNERQFPWMDEGINSFYELRYLKEKYPEVLLMGMDKLFEEGDLNRLAEYFGLTRYHYYHQYLLFYLLNARWNHDQPLSLPAPEYTLLNYGFLVYGKAAAAFNQLYQYLGEENFDRAMQHFYRQWKFRHPYPEDLEKVFNRQTGENLDWLFHGFLRGAGKQDYRISALNQNRVRIKNKGQIAAPFPLRIKAADGNELVWENGFTGKKEIRIKAQNLSSASIDPDLQTLDLRRNANQMTASGIFPASKPLQIRMLGAIPDLEKEQLFFAPVFGANTTDKLLAGLALYNSILPGKKLEYRLMPMYSFNLQRLSGSGKVSYHMYPGQWLRSITISGIGESYAGYRKFEPRLRFFVKPHLRQSFSHYLTLGFPIIETDQKFLPMYEKDYQVFYGKYSFGNDNPVFRFTNELEFRNQREKFIQLSNTFSFDFQYLRQKFINFRWFYGRFLINNGFPEVYNFQVSGSTDYLMQEILLDRRQISPWLQGLANQTDLKQGGFRGFVPLSSDQWLTSINFSSDLPNFSLFSVFADLGYLEGSEGLIYDAGIFFRVIPDILEIYLPLVGNSYPGDTPDQFRDLQHNLRFTLHLDRMNPFELIEKALKK